MTAGGTQVSIRGDFSIISHLLTHHLCGGDHSLHPHLSSESPSDYANRRMSEVLLRFVRPRAANATTERNDDGGDADGRTASLMTQFCCRHFGRFERTAAAALNVLCVIVIVASRTCACRMQLAAASLFSLSESDSLRPFGSERDRNNLRERRAEGGENAVENWSMARPAYG